MRRSNGGRSPSVELEDAKWRAHPGLDFNHSKRMTLFFGNTAKAQLTSRSQRCRLTVAMEPHLASCRWEYVAVAGSFLPLRDLPVEHVDPPDSTLQQAVDGAKSCMANTQFSGNARVICGSSSRLSAWRATLYPSLSRFSVRLTTNMWAPDTSSVEIFHGIDLAGDGCRIL